MPEPLTAICVECGDDDVPLRYAIWANPTTGEHGEAYLCDPCSGIPDTCAGCGKPLMLRRPDRTHCEACRPTIRGVADILASRTGQEQN